MNTMLQSSVKIKKGISFSQKGNSRWDVGHEVPWYKLYVIQFNSICKSGQRLDRRQHNHQVYKNMVMVWWKRCHRNNVHNNEKILWLNRKVPGDKKGSLNSSNLKSSLSSA